MSRKENAAYQYNHRDDHKGLHNHLLNTFVKQYLRDEQNHYPLTEQKDRRYKSTPTKRKEKYRCGQKGSGSSIKKFTQSKQTEARFMNGKENTKPIVNLEKI